jgi:hypothetical protein
MVRPVRRTQTRFAIGVHAWPGFKPSNIVNPNSTGGGGEGGQHPFQKEHRTELNN